MIAKLVGSICYIENEYVILDVMGVGYKVYILENMLKTISLGDKLELFIEMQIRPEQINLFGFADINTQKFFNLLQTVQGVGAKMAMNILNQISIETIINSVLAQDIAIFKNISGVGNKIAQRIVTELKSKKDLVSFSNVSTNTITTCTKQDTILIDALDALEVLGFKRSDAFIAVNEILVANDDIAVEDLVTKALSKMGNL